jgi:hypothetical protein
MAVASYDKKKEAADIAEAARTSVASAALLEVGGLTIGTAVAALATATWLDVTGIAFGVTFMTLGLLVLPARRRRANQELETKLRKLREMLMRDLTAQFEREMRRSTQRIEDVIAPYARFVRAEREKLEGRQGTLSEIKERILSLRHQLQHEAIGVGSEPSVAP